MSRYDELIRRKLLEEIYDGLSEEDKRTFLQLTLQDKRYEDIMSAIASQREQIGRVADKMERQTWLSSFGSDIAANFTSDGIIYLLSRLMRSFKG